MVKQDHKTVAINVANAAKEKGKAKAPRFPPYVVICGTVKRFDTEEDYWAHVHEMANFRGTEMTEQEAVDVCWSSYHRAEARTTAKEGLAENGVKGAKKVIKKTVAATNVVAPDEKKLLAQSRVGAAEEIYNFALEKYIEAVRSRVAGPEDEPDDLFKQLMSDVCDCQIQVRDLRGDAINAADGDDVVGAITAAWHGITALINSATNRCYLVGKHVEDWEELAESGTLPKKEVSDKLMDGLKIAFPFLTDKPEFEQKASHPVCNASRVAVSTLVYMRAAKRARQVQSQHVNKKVCVMDVGAGCFGAERVALLSKDYRNSQLYFHVSLPVVDAADKTRRDNFLKHSDFHSYNFVPERRNVVLGRLNYCYHKAAECDCGKYYDHVTVCTVHAGYYFKTADRENLFSLATSFESIEHIPDVGTTLPKDGQPEFEWVDRCRTGAQKWKAKYRAFLSGVRQVALRPMQTGETMYEHDDTSRMLKNGGYHVNRFTKWAEGMAEPTWESAQNFAKGATLAAATAYMTTPGPVPVKAAAAVVSGVGAVAAMATGVKILNEGRFVPEPPPFTDYTVESHIVNSYTLKETGEEIVHCIRYTKRAPGPILPQAVKSCVVEKEDLGRATAAMVLGGSSDKASSSIAAIMLRDKRPIDKVKETIAQAKRAVLYLNRVEEPPPAPSLPVMLLALGTLPFALAASNWATSIAVAKLGPWLLHQNAYAALKHLRGPYIPMLLTLCCIVPFHLMLYCFTAAAWALLL